MVHPEKSPAPLQPQIRLDLLSGGRKELMLYVFHTMGEQTAVLGAATQKHLAICNMGGIAALLAFAGTKGFDSFGLMVYAFYAFCIGLVLVSISMGCSYHITARMFSRLIDELATPEATQVPAADGKDDPPATPWLRRFADGLHTVAMHAASPLAWLSLAAFVVGIVCGGLALDHLPQPKL